MRLAAVVLALALAAIAVDSALFCVDGCDTDAKPHHSTQVQCGSCVTCQIATVQAFHVPLRSSPIGLRVRSIDERRPASPSADSLDHPPRAI